MLHEERGYGGKERKWRIRGRDMAVFWKTHLPFIIKSLEILTYLAKTIKQ